MNNCSKKGAQLASLMVVLGAALDLPKILDEPYAQTNKTETYICKNCGKEFTPRSYNKKTFCSTKCFLENKNGGKRP